MTLPALLILALIAGYIAGKVPLSALRNLFRSRSPN
jgi:hypothetical protein